MKHFDLDKTGKTTIHLSELEPGDRVTVWGKTWEYLGQSKGELENLFSPYAFFKNVRSRKYPSMARIMMHGAYKYQVDITGMQKMTCTIGQLKDAHGLS